MTNRQKVFVDEYLIDLNATQAAIRAGYSPNSAEVQASKMLSNAKVGDAVARAMADRSRRTGVNQDRVIAELAKIAFVNPTDVIDLDEATIRSEAAAEDTAAIASVKVKVIPCEDGSITEREIKVCDKIKALELLGRHLGMFNDKLKLDNVGPVIIYGDDQIPD